MRPARAVEVSTSAPASHHGVLVLYEPGRAGSAALSLARELAARDPARLTVIGVAPRAERGCCGTALLDFNRAAHEAVADELRQARKLLGTLGEGAEYKVLVEGDDPPLEEWIARDFPTHVLLPARRRFLRSPTHPAAARLRRSTDAAIHVVDPRSQPAPRSAKPNRGDVGRASGSL